MEEKTYSKLCTCCKEDKPIHQYHNYIGKKDGLKTQCKSCLVKKGKKYYRTIDGFIIKIYNSQKMGSKKRNHNPPNYTVGELKEWLLNQSGFKVMWEEYVESGFRMDLAPSIDRKNDLLGYSFNNFNPLTTWGEHDIKSRIDRKTGVNNKVSKVVLQYDMNGNFIKEYYSVRQASRENNLSSGNISNCCVLRTKKHPNGKMHAIKSVGGYKWVYKHKDNG